MEQVKQMLEFIGKSPSCYQTVENVQKELDEAGYVPLMEKRKWELSFGGKYYVVRNGSSLIAFSIPKERIPEGKDGEDNISGMEPAGFHMIASHSDSPCFKIKEEPEIKVEDRYVKLNVEKYGGMILSTWLDRPLSAAGRVVVADGQKDIAIKNVVVDNDLFVIPNVAIHMNRDMNKGMEYNAQTDMLPLYGETGSEGSFQELIAQAAGVKKEDILGSDLFLYNREKGRTFGANGEFICAPRLDDLACVYASLQAMLHAVPERYINLMIVFDNEEVGSTTRQGAASTFLQDTLKRICGAMGIAEDGYHRMVAESFMISADNAHAVHPNHPEKTDPTNRPYLNGGIVIKYHGSQKYTTDAVSAAVMKKICKRAGVPWQMYVNRSDIAGGSTLGNLSAAQVPVRTVDIGLPQLAMHSAYETAGAKDAEYMIRAMECFYNE